MRFRFAERKGQALIRLRRRHCGDDQRRRDILYDYEETNVSIADRRDWCHYVEQFFDDLFAMGLEEKSKPRPKTLEERLAELESIVK